MALRLIEITVPVERLDEAVDVLGDHGFKSLLERRSTDVHGFLRLLTDAEQTGTLTDAIGERFEGADSFHLVILPVEGVMPRLDQASEEDDGSADEARSSNGISREELYADVMDMTRAGRVFIVMTMLSAVVATVGLLRDNVAVIVGAMVIAPLLGPNVALALGTTLADLPLLKYAIRANLIGFLAAFVPAVAAGVVLSIDPTAGEIASRTQVGYSDIVLALAAGGAGTLAITTGTAAALVGVMVAVALLPPTVVTGLLLGAGDLPGALAAGLLTTVNLICINLAGVVTFLAKGVRPLTWCEAERARKATIAAILLWTFILCMLIGLIVFIRKAELMPADGNLLQLQQQPDDAR